jgi:hypothetical protein
VAVVAVTFLSGSVCTGTEARSANTSCTDRSRVRVATRLRSLTRVLVVDGCVGRTMAS